MKTRKKTTKKAAAVKPKTEQPVVIKAEVVDEMLQDIITNAMAALAAWTAVTRGGVSTTGGRDK